MQHGDDWIDYQVLNWNKYNPRKDRKEHGWFRLSMNIATEPKFDPLTASQRFIAVCLLAERGKKTAVVAKGVEEASDMDATCVEHASKGCGTCVTTRVSVSWLARAIRVKSDEVRKVWKFLISVGVLRLPPGDQAVSTGTPTYVRTNERTHERAAPLDRAPSVLPEEVKDCADAWLETLEYFKAGRSNLLEHELTLIGRAIQFYKSARAVKFAIVGVRYEPKDDRYDPARNLSLSRVLPLDPELASKFERLMNLGIQAHHKKAPPRMEASA